MWVILWVPRVTLGKLFRPLNDWFDMLEADVAFIAQKYREANPKR